MLLSKVQPRNECYKSTPLTLAFPLLILLLDSLPPVNFASKLDCRFGGSGLALFKVLSHDDGDLMTLTTLCCEPMLVPELLLLSLLLPRSSRSKAIVTEGGGGMAIFSSLLYDCDGSFVEFALLGMFAACIICCGVCF